jgi:hypothetical protein
MTRALPLLALAAVVFACAASNPTTSTSQHEPVAVPPAASSGIAEPTEPAREEPCGPGRYCPGTPGNALMAELRAVAAQTRACYERALKANPKLEGRLAVALRVLEDGRACRAELADDALQGDAEFQRCLLDTFARQYPPPQAGCVNTMVPLNFRIQQTDGGAPP